MSNRHTHQSPTRPGSRVDEISPLVDEPAWKTSMLCLVEPRSPDPPDTVRWAAFSFAIDQVTAEVTTAFTSASIESVLLKGPTIAKWLYTDEEPRLYIDSDLLIRKVDWKRAQLTMKSLGFEDAMAPLAHPRMESPTSHPWKRATDGANVDLHYTLFGLGADPQIVWSVLFGRSVPEPIGGAIVRTPCYPMRLLHIALHAVQHGGGPQPKPMADLERAAARVPVEAWEEARDLAEELNAIDAFASGLYLIPDGRELAQRLEVEPNPSQGTRLRLEGVPMSEGFGELAATRGLRAKLGLVLREAFPNRTFMRWWTPLAHKGIVGLGVAYAWRLIWLSYRAMPGFLAWRRAAR